jgi:hypothetical protein
MYFKLSILFAVAAFWRNRGAEAQNTCCPNGLYSGDIADACSPTNPGYGNGQCWEQFEINCDNSFSGVETNVYYMDGSNGAEGKLFSMLPWFWY